ncbi:hypothetical protein SAMN05444166_5741 [Singulisphaera sp. GP187]|uniref:hypothetical protein n=1 Tax=Singulisphaera sp. GP187 TaxID=1882752 RepID=UPI0009271877|nr:hypothetical protein [Singulisphaera sp. GP187]SIO58601.1 hypothetical protein SAMN05444166_5741 [Singulisphaera sp. GP187]
MSAWFRRVSSVLGTAALVLAVVAGSGSTAFARSGGRHGGGGYHHGGGYSRGYGRVGGFGFGGFGYRNYYSGYRAPGYRFGSGGSYYAPLYVFPPYVSRSPYYSAPGFRRGYSYAPRFRRGYGGYRR